MNKHSERIHMRIDKDLKRQAQIKAFSERKTLTQVIIQLVTSWVKRGKKNV